MLNTFLYTKFIKNIPVIELFSVTFGFILRLIAGGLVIDVPISKWFMIVGGFGALFLVSTKRLAERRMFDSFNTRKVISKYSFEFLHSSISISGAVALIGYCLWAFGQPFQRFWFELSVIPLVMGLFRYNWMAQDEIVEAPEDAIWGDATLRVLGVGLTLTLTVAIYL
jgi:decaprenyl-phosphate phosphoribosyltransferase